MNGTDMTTERMVELAALYAVGALDGDELMEFQQQSRENDLTRRVTAEYATVAASLVAGRLVVPRASVKHALMRKIQEKHAAERAMEGPAYPRIKHDEGIYTVFPEAIEWSKHPVPGVQFKVLSESTRRGYVTMLMKVEAGTRFPEHHHSGEEECYVLSGSIIINGKRLGAGVLHHGDENSDHAVLSTEEGALLLLVVAKEDYIPPVQ